MWLPDFLFPFQGALTEWSLRQGRAGIFADCGLGKTPMQLVWAENVRRITKNEQGNSATKGMYRGFAEYGTGMLLELGKMGFVVVPQKDWARALGALRSME